MVLNNLETSTKKIMKLPNRDKAYIPLAKIYNYLLSHTHPAGRWKAEFFLGNGFDESTAVELIQQFYNIVNTEEVKEIVSSPYGTKYIVDGKIQTASGKRLPIRTAWIIEKNRNVPRFITAYPLKKKEMSKPEGGKR